MDKKLFEQKLTEVADWHIPRVIDVDHPRRRRDQIITEQDLVNLTLAPEITSLKDLKTPCDSCGKINPNGQKIERKQYMTSNIKYWRSRCVTCGKYENPNTGKFDLTGTEATYQWNNLLRYKKNQDLIKKI